MANSLLGEVRDQSLHIIYASLLTVCFIYPVPPLLAMLLAIVVGTERELEQHHWTNVGKLDLCFWSLGAAFTLLAYNNLSWIESLLNF